MTRADVVVVGGGPAGAAAAFFLAEAGREVVLLDRARFPREKPCGEGILPPGVEVLDRMGVLPSLTGRAFDGIRYHAPNGAVAIGRFPKGHGLGVRRVQLDEALLSAAAARGACVEQDARVRDVIRDSENRIAGVTDGEREWRAPLVIAADGVHSVVRKRAGLDSRATKRVGVRMHFRASPPDERVVDVYVGNGTEAYVTPVAADEIGVATLTTSPDSAGEDAVRASLRGRGGIASLLANAPAISEPLAAAGMGAVARAPLTDGLLLHGDAAGSPDPITGMGIAFALRCASRLPEALAPAFAANDFSAAKLRPWAALRRREVAGGFAVTRAVMLCAARDHLANAAVRVLSAMPSLFPTLFRLATPR